MNSGNVARDKVVSDVASNMKVQSLTNQFLDLSVTENKKKEKVRARRKHKAEGERKVKEPLKVVVDYTYYVDAYQQLIQNDCSEFSTNGVVVYGYLNKNTKGYRDIANSFRKYKLIVKSVKTVHNPYLQRAFDLKRKFHYGDIEPQLLFHGTKRENVDNICTYNFDWRLSGSKTGFKFGKGVNFAKKPIFAVHFCDRTANKVMIMADVLVKDVTPGSQGLVLPPVGCDTTSGKSGTVLVKFEDHEFCPRYIIDFFQPL